MPYKRTTPVHVSKPIQDSEIVQFAIDVKTKMCTIWLNHLGDRGELIDQQVIAVSLFDASKKLRYTAKLESNIKKLLYDLLVEDGHLIGGDVG